MFDAKDMMVLMKNVSCVFQCSQCGGTIERDDFFWIREEDEKFTDIFCSMKCAAVYISEKGE